MASLPCRSQSLALRLSQDCGPGVELLLRAPSTHRSDIARMLQLQQRRETDRKLRCGDFPAVVVLLLSRPNVA